MLKHQILLLIAFLFTVSILFLPQIEAKAGGVSQNNYTALTADNSQNPPNCGLNCHINTLASLDLEVNLTANYSSTMTVNTTQIITINLITNISTDEISILFMNRTQPDNTGTWTIPENIFITNNNQTTHTDNLHQNLTAPRNSTSYELTIFATEIGNKSLTLHARGGLNSGPSNDWHKELNLSIEVLPIIFITPCVGFVVSFNINPAGNCPIDSCWITVDTNGNFTFMNISIDDRDEVEICENGTLEQFQLTNLGIGFHTLNISTKMGDKQIKIKTVSDVLNGTEIAEETSQEVNLSMAAIAIALLALGFFGLSTRFEELETIMIRIGCIAVGILLALQSVLVTYETTTATSPAIKLLILVVWLMVVTIFMGLLFRIFKFMSKMPNNEEKDNY